MRLRRGLTTGQAGGMVAVEVGPAMTTLEHNDDYHHRLVRKAVVCILAAALGSVVARMVTDKGFDRYRAGDGGERPLSTLADAPDASEVLKAALDYWREVFQPHFGHPRHRRVEQMVHNVRSIRNRYVGGHPRAECDYEPYGALDEIARLLRQFSADDAARQVDDLKRELGSLMYGQPTAATPSAAGDNVILTRDALAMLIADAVSEVAQQLRFEPDLAGLRLSEGGGPSVGGSPPALPLPTVPPVVAPTADADPMVVPAPAVEDAAPVSAENVRLAEDAFSRGYAHDERGEFDQAVAEYTVAIRLNPQGDVAYFAYGNRGNAYAGQADYDRAIADYTAAIGLNPWDADAYFNRGYAYLIQEDYDRAIVDYTAAIELDPQDDANAYRIRGIAYHKQGDYDRAIVDYTAAIELDPQDAAAYFNRGYAYFEQGDYDRAIVDYTAAIELNPQDAGAYNWRGAAHFRQGGYGLAIADYTAAIELNPQDAKAYYNRGVAYGRQGECDLAIADCTAAIELNPQDAKAYYNRGVAYGRQGECDLAIADCTAAIELNPQDAKAYYNRGVAYDRQRECDLAIADYTAAIELDPQLAEAYNNRGVVYVALGEYELAIEDIDQAIAIDPDADRFSEVRDLIIRLRGDSAEYDQAIADAPDDPANWHLRGLYYSERDEYGRAVDNYTRALELVTGDGNAAEIYSDRGLAWARLGDDERAMADFDRAIDANPNLAEAWYNRGLAWRRRGEHGNAVLDFTSAIGVRANYALAYYGRSISHGVLGNGEQAAADFERARELGFQA